MKMPPLLRLGLHATTSAIAIVAWTLPWYAYCDGYYCVQ